MNATQRRQAIENRSEPANRAVRLWCKDQWRDFLVTRVPVDALLLNVDNRRFAAERTLMESKLGHTLDPENSEDDEISVISILLDTGCEVDGNLVKGTPSKDYELLKVDWLRRKQASPFWVRPDGTVRNGNRRLAMLKRLRNDGITGTEWVEAVVLNPGHPDNIDEHDLFEMEQREQLTEDFKVRYTDMNLLLALRQAAIDSEIDWFDPDSIKKVQDGAKKRPTLELDPDTSPVVERIFDMAQAGKGMLPIAETLNDEGIASPAGKLWSKNTVHFILKNEVYTGTLIWGAKSKDKAEPVRVEKAFPAIVSKTRFRRVNSLMRSRAPKIAHPRRVASSYLLSGLVKCKACNRALSGQDAKSGQFSYYVCQSIMKRGKDACKTPRLNARRFEEMVVGKIRSNVLTDGNIRALVKVVDEQMDGVAQEQRTKLETIEDELEDVKRKLGRIWHFIETADNVEMTDASDRIREHRDRQGRLEDLAAEARAILSQRRADLDDVETIAAYAQDMSEFLKESELTERRAFIETFVKEIVVMPGDALLRYTIPMPDDSRIPGRNAEEMPLDGSVLSTVKIGGPECTVLRTFRWEVLI